MFDFSSVNAGFQDLLTQVSQLESVISMEFNADEKENRKSFDQKIDRELTLLDDHESLALIVFDINGFKWINDSFGHVAGDKVLKVVADNLKKNFRKTDFVARYGGDEFVVLLNGLSQEMVQERIDGFKSLISRIKFVSHARQMDIKVSVSAGMAMASPGDSGAALLYRADQAMYEDKKKTVPATDSPSVSS